MSASETLELCFSSGKLVEITWSLVDVVSANVFEMLASYIKPPTGVESYFVMLVDIDRAINGFVREYSIHCSGGFGIEDEEEYIKTQRKAVAMVLGYVNVVNVTIGYVPIDKISVAMLNEAHVVNVLNFSGKTERESC